MQEQGKIDRLGVSNFDAGLLEKCAAGHPIDTAQVPLSLISRSAGRDVLPWTVGHRVCTLAFSPLESGLLSGRFSMQRLQSLPNDDRRRERKQFLQPRLGRTLALLERLESIAASLGMSLAQLAIAWTVAWPGVTGVIVGARTAEQVDGWAGTSDRALGASALEQIEAALIATRAGDGPTHPHRGESAGPVRSTPSPWAPRTAPSR